VGHAGSGVTSTEPGASDRRLDATIEGLTVALCRLHRGAAALKAENDQLRAEVGGLRTAARGRHSGVASLPEFGQLAEIAVPTDLRGPGAGVVALRSPDLQTGRGFGLQLLERVATHWGLSRGHSTTVWFEMARA
jgi:hypothetical protein